MSIIEKCLVGVVCVTTCSQAVAQNQAVVLPPLHTNLEATFTPNANQAGSWDLSAVGYRSASPTSDLEAYGYASTASAGWEEFTFGAWSDDPTSIDPDYDPHLEYVLQTPEVWQALSYFATNSYGYEVSETEIDFQLCIDDGCSTPLPSSLMYDPSGAYAQMEEFSVSAPQPTKTMRQASTESGTAGVALVESLRQQGKTDTEIDSQYPGLLEPAILYITPPTAYNAYFNPIQYTVYDDNGDVVNGAPLVMFLQSKGMSDQMIYEIVNGMPLSSPSEYAASEGGGGDQDWENVEIEVEITGGVGGETGFPTNSISAHAEFRIKIKGTAGQIANGGQEAVQMVTDVAQAAVDKVNETIQDQANANSGSGSISPTQIKIVQAVAQVAGWFGSLF